MPRKTDPEVKEVKRPMGVSEPTTEDRMDAMQAEMKAMKDWINRHNRTHFGRDAI
jgi:hypothetical protein